jgi:uncharacterized linocin/CFP29 family protein
MSHLLREFAPITAESWKLLDDEARDRLSPGLGARRLVSFSGPHGWEYSSSNLGRVEDIKSPDGAGLQARRRRVLPLVELRAPFSVARDELRAADRGAQDVDLGALDEAAQRLVVAENVAIFHGWKAAGIEGIAEASPHAPIAHGSEVERYPERVARAVELLLRSGIAGPFGIALGAEEYTSVVETAEHGGYPLFDHLREILGGPIVWAPGVQGAVVASTRGGDFLFESGQDLSVGYEAHDADSVQLYIEESFSFRIATPEAAVAIAPRK